MKSLSQVSEKLDKNQPNLDIQKCKELEETIYKNCTVKDEIINDTFSMASIVHLQHLMLVAGFNLLVNEDEGDKMDIDPIPLRTVFNDFDKGYAFENLEMIVRQLMYTDLFEDLEPLKDKGFLTHCEQDKMIALQKETFDRILRELHTLARKRISDRQKIISLLWCFNPLLFNVYFFWNHFCL